MAKRKMRMKTKAVLKAIGPEQRKEIAGVLRDLIQAGMSRKDAIDVIVEGVDELFDFDEIVAGPAGEALEAADGPIIRAVVVLLAVFIKPKPA